MGTFRFIPNSGSPLNLRGPNAYIQNAVGLGRLASEVQAVVSPVQDGERFRSVRATQRTITGDLILVATAGSTLDTVRRGVAIALNPKLGLGVLEVQVGSGDTYRIDALCERWDASLQLPTVSRGAIQFRCPDPYWRSASSVETGIVVGAGGMAVPTAVPTEISATNGATGITNQGDIDSYPVTVVTGNCLSPTLTNSTTGKALAFSGLDMDAGESLTIDHLRGTAELEGVDVTEYLTSGSEFWPLEPGTNTVTLSVTSGTPQATVTYYHRYSGI